MKTRVVDDNNNPIFYNTLETFFYSADIDWSPPIVLDIYDQDTGTFDSDDFIGRSVIFIDKAQSSISRNDSVPTPQWFPIKMGFSENEPVIGQLLASFSILNPKEKFVRSLDSIRLAPHCDEYLITINVLGLRNLESPGILPVRKPFINFMLRSLLPPSRSHAVENISTQPSATGANPTISTVVKFKIKLPDDPLYCPSLTCGVYDYIFKGMAQPLIGSFEIDIGELQQRSTREFEKHKKKTGEIIKDLEQKIKDAEELKEKLEKQRAEGMKEKENEEEMKKAIKAYQTTKNFLKGFDQKKSEKYKMLTEEDDLEEDIEMGVMGSEHSDTMQRMAEDKEVTKEEAKDMEQANLFTQLTHKRIDEDEESHDEKNAAKQMIDAQKQKMQTLKQNRTIRMKKMFRQMKLVGKNVVFPIYEYDDRLKIHREGIPPPKEVYMPVGYDPRHDSKQKHYRRFFEDELEHIKEIMPESPFSSYVIKRGQSRGLSKGWFWQKQNTDECGQISTVKEVGEFKAIVTVVNKHTEEELENVKKAKIEILKESLNILSQKLFNEPFNFDYENLRNAEGKELFAAKLQQMG